MHSSGDAVMHDADVRQATWKMIKGRKENRDALLLDEFDLCGEVRVDIAVLNGHMTGYELKSSSDNLSRLQNQICYYSKILDYCNLVVAENHLDEAMGMVPDFWGIYIARQALDSRTYLRKIRSSKSNKTNVDPYSLVQLLWRDETLDILARYGLDQGVRSKPRQFCWDRLAGSFSVPRLRELVRTQLEARTNWRENRRNPISRRPVQE